MLRPDIADTSTRAGERHQYIPIPRDTRIGVMFFVGLPLYFVNCNRRRVIRFVVRGGKVMAIGLC